MEPLIEKMGLPVVKIHDTDFFLYTPGLLFQQVGNPDNQIFFTQLRDQGTHTLLLFDTRTLSAYKGNSKAFIVPKHVVKVILPPLKTLMGPGLTEVAEQMRQYLQKNKQAVSDQSINALKKNGPKK